MEIIKLESKEEELIYKLLLLKEVEEAIQNSCGIAIQSANKKISQLKKEIKVLGASLSQSLNINEEDYMQLYEEIIIDARNIHQLTAEKYLEGINNETIIIEPFNLSKFIDCYVVGGLKNDAFGKLFWYIDQETRVNFLKEHYLGNVDIYFTPCLEHLILFEVK